MANLELTLAIGDYDHVRDLADATVPVTGVDLNVVRLPVEEIFYRSLVHREFDASELSFAKVVALAAAGERRFVPLPVFPSRVFRHSSMYVHRDSGLDDPKQLAGKRIGVPEWAQTAAVYSRGLLAHEYGVDLRSIEWVQAGVNDAGRKEKVALTLPEGVRLRTVVDRSLSEMLLARDLDAVFSARPPAPLVAGDERIVRLFRDARTAERAYFRKTGIYPIMHVIALRADHYEANPWLAMNLFEAFAEAKRRSLARAADRAASFFPLPWVFDQLEDARALFGVDSFPYGIARNRVTLDAFLGYAFEQGVCCRRLAPEELFPPEVAERYRI